MNEKTKDIVIGFQPSLLSLFCMFIKIGSTAFGGYMALISVVKNHLVDKEKLLTDEDMLDGISLATILPGPVAVNVVVYAGYRIAGIMGAVTCGVAVILPSFFLILCLSFIYFQWGEMPIMYQFFKGVLPAIAAIIIMTALSMAKKSLTGFNEIAIAITSLLILIFIDGFFTTIFVITSAGFIGFLFFKKEMPADAPLEISSKNIHAKVIIDTDNETSNKKYLRLLIGASLFFIVVTLSNTEIFLAAKLLAAFSSMSVFLFGGGFVFIPLMHETVVETYQWVSDKEFIDAIAMGQITPGPMLISATFVGYKVAGVFGAIIATIGIFAPPAMIMLACTHYFKSIKKSQNVQYILKGIRCSVIGMIIAASYVVSISAEKNIISVVIFVGAIYALVKIKLDVIWVVLMAGLVGLIAYA